jgi:hypothetical protein
MFRYSPQDPVIKTLSLCSSFRIRDQVSHPYKVTRTQISEFKTTDLTAGCLFGITADWILLLAGSNCSTQYLILARAVGPQAAKEMDIFGWGAACGLQ